MLQIFQTTQFVSSPSPATAGLSMIRKEICDPWHRIMFNYLKCNDNFWQEGVSEVRMFVTEILSI